MATVAGYLGRVAWAGVNLNFGLNAYSWTLSYDAGEGETTDFTSAGPKTFIPLTTEWSGSFVTRLDATTAIPAIGIAASVLSLYISFADNFGYEGSAFSTSATPGQDVNGLPELTVNFRGTGVLTLGAI